LIAGDGFPYGYKKLTIHLKEDYGLIINHKKVYRLCKELNILRPQRKINPLRPKKLAKREKVTAPNQQWQADVKYVAPVKAIWKSACSDAADKRCKVRYQPVHLVGKPYRGTKHTGEAISQ